MKESKFMISYFDIQSVERKSQTIPYTLRSINESKSGMQLFEIREKMQLFEIREKRKILNWKKSEKYSGDKEKKGFHWMWELLTQKGTFW